jgi:ribonuclease BN (tRNA processing enzyme)
MRLTVLGCAGSFPGPDSACSAYLVEAEGFALLLDFGTGSLSALQRYGDLRQIDAIVLSHLHCDHMLDACSYVVVRRWAPDGPYPRLPVYAPAGVRERIAAAYGTDEGPLDDVYAFHALTPGTFTLGPFKVSVERVNHPVETYGVRLEHAGKVLAYSADTGESPALVKLAAGADLMLCEASFVEGDPNPPGVHLTGRQAAQHAAQAGAGALLLTHLVPWNDQDRVLAEAAPAFPGPVSLAHSGLTVDV